MNSNAVRAWAMVGVQALLFLAVAVTAFLQDVGPRLFTSLWVGLALVILGSAGVIASGRNLGRSLTPSPVPNEAGLAASGLYRYARHPMYTALVVICLGVAVGSGALLCYLAVLALAVFFGFKARMEERYLRRVYNGYDAYAARTGRFVPGIGRRRG
jgi:protein-S-isoprenylcysteine O-methyltransferase Ste14